MKPKRDSKSQFPGPNANEQLSNDLDMVRWNIVGSLFDPMVVLGYDPKA